MTENDSVDGNVLTTMEKAKSFKRKADALLTKPQRLDINAPKTFVPEGRLVCQLDRIHKHVGMSNRVKRANKRLKDTLK